MNKTKLQKVALVFGRWLGLFLSAASKAAAALWCGSMLFKVQGEWRDVKLQGASVVYVECCREAADERSKPSLIMKVQQVGAITDSTRSAGCRRRPVRSTQNFGRVLEATLPWPGCPSGKKKEKRKKKVGEGCSQTCALIFLPIKS